MNEKKFHELIEKSLTDKEKEQKELSFQEVKRKAFFEGQSQKKHQIKLLYIILPIALILVVIPVFVFIINFGYNVMADVGDYDSTVSETNSQTQPVRPFDSSLSGSNANSADQTYMFTVHEFFGTIVIESGKKFFKTYDEYYFNGRIEGYTNGVYIKEITSNIPIIDTNTGKPFIDHYTGELMIPDELTQDRIVVAKIIVYTNHDGAYNVGDIFEISI